ncbi:MAG: ABC transporter ATP-binding protein [Gammaproteobacteria bacterium]
MTDILQVRKLVKRYPSVTAVDGIDLNINTGSCFGLLGPNGAGKTTTVEMIEGIISPTSGEIVYKAAPIGNQFRQEAGIQFQSTALQDFLTVREILELFGSFYIKRMAIDKLIELCALDEFADRDSRKISGGQRQRLLLAMALVNDPEILFLDEPTTGLDPQARRNFWALIEGIKEQNKTILLTTHYMEEAYRLCDRIAIMDHGKLIAEGTPRELLAQHFEDIVIEIPRQDFDIDPAKLPFKVFESGEHIEISTRDVNTAFRALLDNGISLSNMRIREHTLEDLFLELTGKELRA